MNHLPMHPNSAENLQAPEGLWRKTVAFLQRDVKSLFPSAGGEAVAKEPNESGSETVAGTLADTPVESLVDFNKLPDLAFRREVLDWRDNFHANVTLTVARLEELFIEQMHAELGNTSLFRKVIARPSDEILQDSFVRLVRVPLIAVLRQEEAKLKASAQKWALLGKVDLAFDLRRLNAECATLHDLGFKTSKRNLILSRIQTLMLGSAGIAEHFRDQGQHLSGKLMEARES
ncbi:hypothetical protein [Acidovorax sp. CCYZU-2555]|uniref:hypothetical protein n=1 Tax=Acidovorax sp. CCYZU-2555 TaxID=2835042 RepID=UPI001BD0F440|nr:hypothetical protein [Acidovorax sp. CCYZU-2555]MBS7780082.1 hypothetical protein [Acidovorax sp. CCYZU-2555]